LTKTLVRKVTMGVLRPRLHRRFTMLTRKTPAARVACTAAFLVLALALVPVALAKGKPGGGGGGSTGGSGCSILPGQVALDQVWTVSAWGLPSTVNMIITFPDGGQGYGPVPVANGTFTTTGNSNMTKDWGFIAPEQTGTYTYQFVGKISLQGTFNTLYATCKVQVG
jgi:hypothetical protein